jgi:hypothetical protein
MLFVFDIELFTTTFPSCMIKQILAYIYSLCLVLCLLKSGVTAMPSRTFLIDTGHVIYRTRLFILKLLIRIEIDEDINPDKGTATPTKPAQAPPGPLTRAHARELNFVMILKNEGPEAS